MALCVCVHVCVILCVCECVDMCLCVYIYMMCVCFRHEVSMQSLQDVGQGVGADVVEEVGVVDNEESVTTGNDNDLSQPQPTAGLTADMGGTSTISQHDLQNSGLTDAFAGTTLDQTLNQTLNQQVCVCVCVSFVCVGGCEFVCVSVCVCV